MGECLPPVHEGGGDCDARAALRYRLLRGVLPELHGRDDQAAARVPSRPGGAATRTRRRGASAEEIFDAIAGGYRSEAWKAELRALDAKTEQLEAALHVPEPPTLHPSMAHVYRDKATALAAGSNGMTSATAPGRRSAGTHESRQQGTTPVRARASQLGAVGQPDLVGPRIELQARRAGCKGESSGRHSVHRPRTLGVDIVKPDHWRLGRRLAR